MKKIFTLLMIVVVMQLSIFAQSSFEVYRVHNGTDTPLNNGDSFTINTEVGEEEYGFEIKVKNTSNSSVTATIKKRTSAVEGSTNNMCSPVTVGSPDGQCVISDETFPFILAPSETSSAAHFAFFQNDNPGTSTITYSVANTEDLQDVFIFHVTYTTETTGVKNNTLTNFVVYPNPASNNFNIVSDFGPKTYVEVYNLLGKVVERINPVSTGENASINVDCSKWENGYYFCRLYNNGKVEKTVKLIVTH